MNINFQSTFTAKELGRYAYAMFLHHGRFLSTREIRGLSRVANDNEVPATLLTDAFMAEAQDYVTDLCGIDGIVPERFCTDEQLAEVAACRTATVTPLTDGELREIEYKVACWDAEARRLAREASNARRAEIRGGDQCSTVS